MNLFRKESGKISKTNVFNVIFLVLLAAEVILAHFGFDSFVPDPLVAGPIATLLLAVVNIVLRKKFTSEPIA